MCPQCGKRHLVKNGYCIRDFLWLPIGGKKVIIRMRVQRYKCRDCDYDRQEKIPFATGSRSYTHRFAKYVVDLLRGMTLQDVSNHLGVSWDTVNEIHSTYLERHYNSPSLEGVENIGIDEFAVRKGHVYKTIVVDLDSGRVLYVGDGKGAYALTGFWRKVKRKGISIKHVATDLSAAFIASVMENCPGAVHVFDHFHVVKLMNEKLDDIRRKVYSMEKDVNKRKVLKGTRYLLLGNGADIFDKQHKTRLDNALAMNEPLSKAYYRTARTCGVRGRKTKVGRKLLRFPPTRLRPNSDTLFGTVSHIPLNIGIIVVLQLCLGIFGNQNNKFFVFIGRYKMLIAHN